MTEDIDYLFARDFYIDDLKNQTFPWEGLFFFYKSKTTDDPPMAKADFIQKLRNLFIQKEKEFYEVYPAATKQQAEEYILDELTMPMYDQLDLFFEMNVLFNKDNHVIEYI